jgi:hypothetical protein
LYGLVVGASDVGAAVVHVVGGGRENYSVSSSAKMYLYHSLTDWYCLVVNMTGFIEEKNFAAE